MIGTFASWTAVAGGQRVRAFTIDIGDEVEIYGGANNVLDKDPPIVAGVGGCGNTFPATYDYAGTTFFLGFTVKTF